MPKAKVCLLLFILFITATGIAKAAPLSTFIGKINVDRRERMFIQYVPANWQKLKNLPLVLALHGYGGDAEDMEKLAGFSEYAEKDPCILVYPEGVNKGWNDGRGRNADVDDVKFISQLIDLLLKQYPIDPKKVFVTGMSNGAFMSMRLACELSNKIAAVAAVSGGLDTLVDNHCKGITPVSVMLIHGNADKLIPVEGGPTRGLPGSYVMPHAELMMRWVKRDKCNTAPIITIMPDVEQDRTFATKTQFTGGQGKTDVIGYIIEGAGHTWPGGYQLHPVKEVGKTSHNLNASEEIWNFFKTHARP